MRYEAIFFDLDGTLLPMDTHEFAKAYFGGLCREVSVLGIQPEQMFHAMAAGVKSMIANDGSITNDEHFWRCFTECTGVSRETAEPFCARYYQEGFHQLRAATAPNPLASQMVALAHEKAPVVVLATNPLFPMEAQSARLSWVGLTPADFDLVTCYTSDRFSKPNPAYYIDVCRRLNVDPARCLMIGNDDREDMQAGTAAGLETWLITDCRIPAEPPWQGVQGSFAQIMERLRSL